MTQPSPTRKPGNSRNLLFAAIFVLISAAMGIHAATTMNIGTPENMGPGFFPVMLSGMLAFLAVLVGFTSLPENTPPLRLASARATILVISAPLIFAATIRTLGLVLAILITTFVVSFASKHATLTRSIVLSAGFTVFCVVLFGYLLDLPIPLLGRVFTG